MHAGQETARRSRRRWLLAAAACLVPFAAARAAPAKRAAAPEDAWIRRAAQLVEAARANANVGDFRRDIRDHRERLREIVRANRTPPPEVLELHRTMILTHALLHAASECHKGGRIVCPPDLLRQLEEQLRIGFARLAAAGGGRP